MNSAVYFWVCLASCLYYLFTVHLHYSFMGIEKYRYNIFIYCFSLVVSHFMLAEQSTTLAVTTEQASVILHEQGLI